MFEASLPAWRVVLGEAQALEGRLQASQPLVALLQVPTRVALRLQRQSLSSLGK